jgi:hypothetical protein
MAKKETIHGWAVEPGKNGDNPALRLTKSGRNFMVVVGEKGIKPEVLREYATTRVLEAEVAAGETGAEQKLANHMQVSRANQAAREAARRVAELAEGDN